jgi:hypothetical protein
MLLKLGERLTSGLAVALLALAVMAGPARAELDLEQDIVVACNLNSPVCVATELITGACAGPCPVPRFPGCFCGTSWLTGICVCL